ncbi:MAG TPA: rhodanese-like domain-containing protein [Magnetospirillaceae bacterium]|jgi:rhodanese-related sulfurtransferase
MPDQVKMIDVQTAQDWIDSGKAVVVDVREANEYQAAHIKGAHLRALSSFNPSDLPQIPEGKHLLLHCRTANRCGTAAGILLQSGYKGEINRMAGGIIAWANAGLPLESGS